MKREACGLLMLMLPSVANSATYQGINITFDALPTEAKALIAPGATPADFGIRLKQGGTVTLDGVDTILNPVSPTQKSLAFLALDRLELKNGARIITNGNTLVLFVNTLSSDNGRIISFDQGHMKASPGGPAVGTGGSGNPGATGTSAGLVSIHVIQRVEGQLHVDLSGQEGGNGSAGNQGGRGTQGSRGGDAQDGPGGWLTPGWCAKGGADGGQGGVGFSGGSGGAGGAGGDGGILELYNVGADPIPLADYDFRSVGGQGGANGAGGPGGPGGPGGDGGSGSTWCSGGHAGPTGPTGLPGYTIPTPASTGVIGQAVVKALTLEAIINSATSPSQPNQLRKLLVNRALLK